MGMSTSKPLFIGQGNSYFYEAYHFRGLLELLPYQSSGVIEAMDVELDAGRQLQINPGRGYWHGDDMTDGLPVYCSKTDTNFVSVEEAFTNQRKDLVYARVLSKEYLDLQFGLLVDIVKGPEDGTLNVPATPTNSIPLAVITVDVGAPSILPSKIQDARNFIGFQPMFTDRINPPEGQYLPDASAYDVGYEIFDESTGRKYACYKMRGIKQWGIASGPLPHLHIDIGPGSARKTLLSGVVQNSLQPNQTHHLNYRLADASTIIYNRSDAFFQQETNDNTSVIIPVSGMWEIALDIQFDTRPIDFSLSIRQLPIVNRLMHRRPGDNIMNWNMGLTQTTYLEKGYPLELLLSSPGKFGGGALPIFSHTLRLTYIGPGNVVAF